MAVEEVTTKFKVDISDLKSGITEANKQIKLANAEFKAAAAGMDNWSKSADGLQAKLKQLDTLLQSNRLKLEIYQKKVAELEKADKSYTDQIEKVRAAMTDLVDKGISKTSEEYKKYENALNALEKNQISVTKELDDARIAMTNQQGVVNGIEKDIRNYESALNDLKNAESKAADEAKKAGNAYNALKSKIDEQEKELSSLKNEYASVVIEQGKNSDSAKALAKQIDSLSSELNQNKTSLEKADKAADEFDKSLNDVESGTKKASDGFTVMKGVLADLVASGIKAAITGLKNMATASYTAWKSYDEGADMIITATGATGKAAEKLIGVYENVSKSVVSDFADIGKAVGEVSTRFGLMDTELEKTSEKFIKFAEINDVDVKTSIDNVQSAMAAFGLGAEDTSNMLDVLNKAGQDTGVSVDELSKQLVANAPALQEMGLNASDSAMFLANLSKNGVDASSVMSGMKKALANAAAEGKPMSQAMSEIEDSIQNATSSTEAITLATELFGTKAGPAIATAVRSGKLSFEEFGTTLTDFQGNVETTYEKMLDGPDKIALAMQNLKLEAAKVFDTFLQKHGPQIEKMVNNFTTKVLPKATNALGTVLNAVSWAVESLDKFADAITIAGTAVGTFLIVMNWGSIMAAAVTALNAVITAVITLNTVILSNPIALLIAAIAALIVAGVKLIKHFAAEEKAIKDVQTAQENLTKAKKEAENAEKSYTNAVDQAEAAQKKLTEAEKASGIAGAELYKQVQEGTLDYADMTEQQREVYKAYLDSEEAQKALKESTETLTDAKKQETIASYENDLALAKESGSYEEFKESVVDAYNQGILSAEEARDLIGAAMSEMSRRSQRTFVKDIPEDITNGLNPKNYKTTGQKLSEWFGSLWDGIKEKFTDAKDYFGTKFGEAYDAMQEKWSNAKEWASNKWTEIKENFSNADIWFEAKFADAWAKIKEKFSGWGKYWGDLWNEVKEKFSSLGTKLGDAIGGSVKAGINSVIDLVEKTMNKAIGLINGAINAINKLPGVNVGKIKEISLPRLAQGGVLKKGQVGLLEGSGAEAVVPLEKNKQWIHAVANDLLKQLGINGPSASINNSSNNNVNNFTQNIYAPKQPSRIELYRQTRNLLTYVGEVGGV